MLCKSSAPHERDYESTSTNVRNTKLIFPNVSESAEMTDILSSSFRLENAVLRLLNDF